MFRSTTIIRESQYPYQSHYYLNTVVCIRSAVVWQHNCNIIITEQQVGEANPLYALANTKQILPRDITASHPQY